MLPLKQAINTWPEVIRTRFQSVTGQLEIWMWRAVVAFLKWKPGSMLPLAVLVVGISLMLAPVGFLVYRSGQQALAGRAEESGLVYLSPRATQDTSLGQHNLLLVLVDDLDRPQVEGIWLVVNGSLNNGSKFLPVEFQTDDGPGSAENGRTMFDGGGVPSKSFVDELINRGLWWDYYLVIDQAGLSALTGWSARSGFKGALTSTGEASESNTGSPSDTQGVYQQAASLRELCERSALINQSLDPETVLALLEGHFQTDYQLSRLAEEWYAFRHRGFAWYCEFPTIQEISFIELDNGN